LLCGEFYQEKQFLFVVVYRMTEVWDAVKGFARKHTTPGNGAIIATIVVAFFVIKSLVWTIVIGSALYFGRFAWFELIRDLIWPPKKPDSTTPDPTTQGPTTQSGSTGGATPAPSSSTTFLTTPAPFTPTGTLYLKYRGVAGGEDMEVLINNTVVHKDLEVTTTPKEITLQLASYLPLKTIVVNYPTDPVGHDLIMDSILLDGVDIRRSFTGPAGAYDEPRKELVRQGQYLWPGKYTYTAA